MKKILIIADLKDWVLGEIARNLSDLLMSSYQINILYSHQDDFLSSFQKLHLQSDIIHFLSPWDFFTLANIVNKPCVVMLWHMVDWTEFNKYVDRIDTLCVGSEQWLQQTQERLPLQLPFKRVYYGLNIDKFQKQDSAKLSFLQKNNLKENTIIFGFAGSAWSNEENRKGLDRLLQSLVRLKLELDIPFILRIIGRHWSPNIIPLELQSVTKLELDLPSSKLPEFYSSLDYYVCTSRYEGVPYPVLEAMSCESTVISTSVGIVPEIICHNQNGFILSENNLENDFITIIQKTANNLKFRHKCGYLARKTIVESFDWKTSINPIEYQKVYETAIKFYQSRSYQEKIQFILKSQMIIFIKLLNFKFRSRLRFLKRILRALVYKPI